MKILGIDYGRKKIGLALSEGALAEPWMVLRVNNPEGAVKKILQIQKEECVDKTVVGISEQNMAEESKLFAQNINAEIYDETLSTLEAQRLSREAGISKKKRKLLEDAYAACVMLQLYLDNNV